MLKVKVEPVEPTLYGKVPLPNNPLTIAGYQVFCNEEEQHDEKASKLIEQVVEDHVDGSQDGEIEGADRMMTDCCGENDLMVGDLGGDGDGKVEDSLHIGEYVENDVMVDNNIVEEQVVEDGMVLVSSVTNDADDVIQVPYLTTAPTEVLVIEEGAELMVENIHGISHMVMDDDNREYLISTDNSVLEGDHRPDELALGDGIQQIAEEETENFNQPDHVVVERINYEMPLIQTSDASQYFFHGEQIVQTTKPVVVEDQVDDTLLAPKMSKTEKSRASKNKKTSKKESKTPESTHKKKKVAKRKAGEAINSTDDGITPEKNTNKSRKRQKSGPSEENNRMLSASKEDITSHENKETTSVSPIQANHPTLSSLLLRTGPLEILGPVPEPVLPVKKKLFSSPPEDHVPNSMTSMETEMTGSTTSKSNISLPHMPPSPVMAKPILPKVVTEINEQEVCVQLTEKKSIHGMLKGSIKVKHSRNDSKKVSKSISTQNSSTSTLKTTSTPSAVRTLLQIETVPVVSKTIGNSGDIVKQNPILSSQEVIAQSVSLTNPITVAVADTLAIANLPTPKPASLLTVPKPAPRLKIDMIPSPTSKSMPIMASPPIAAVPSTSPARTPVTSPLNITVCPTSAVDNTLYSTSDQAQDPLVSPIQKKYQTVTTTLQAKLAAKTITSANGMETLADRYMKEWKPTGRFQCKLCLYSCVTHNFLFRHWVLNHCSLRPYMCGHCGFQSATRDGVTRHQTAKHRGLARRIFIDNEQQELLWNKFDEMFQGSGFVTELERQAQTTYTLGNADKSLHNIHVQSKKVGRSLSSEERSEDPELSGGTILKVPQRDNVPGKFREVILSSEDDQDLASSQESGEEEEAEYEGSLHYFDSPEGIAYKTTVSTQAASEMSTNSSVNRTVVIPANLAECGTRKKQSCDKHQLSRKKTAGSVQSQVREAAVEEIYHIITSGIPTSKRSEEPQGQLQAATVENKAAQLLSAQVVTSPKESFPHATTPTSTDGDRD